jgi:hypothetical protein
MPLTQKSDARTARWRARALSRTVLDANSASQERSAAAAPVTATRGVIGGLYRRPARPRHSSLSAPTRDAQRVWEQAVVDKSHFVAACSTVLASALSGNAKSGLSGCL